MTGKGGLSTAIASLGLLGLLVGPALAAAWRPGRDPAKDRVIWNDTFDVYSQLAYNNSQWWLGGPLPPGSPTGTYPAKGGTPDGCGQVIQTNPADWEQARQRWLSNNCSTIHTEWWSAAPANFQANVDPNCGVSGEQATTRGMFAVLDDIWQVGMGYNSLAMFTHDFYAERIQTFQSRAWDSPNPTAVNGTDEHPLTLVFYLHDMGAYGTPNTRSISDNSYVELNLDGEHAPTDYIWWISITSMLTARRWCPRLTRRRGRARPGAVSPSVSWRSCVRIPARARNRAWLRTNRR